MASVPGSLDCVEKLPIVRVTVNRIDFGRVDDKQRRCIVLMEEPRVGLSQPLQVAGIDGTFKR